MSLVQSDYNLFIKLNENNKIGNKFYITLPLECFNTIMKSEYCKIKLKDIDIMRNSDVLQFYNVIDTLSFTIDGVEYNVDRRETGSLESLFTLLNKVQSKVQFVYDKDNYKTFYSSIYPVDITFDRVLSYLLGFVYGTTYSVSFNGDYSPVSPQGIYLRNILLHSNLPNNNYTCNSSSVKTGILGVVQSIMTNENFYIPEIKFSIESSAFKSNSIHFEFYNEENDFVVIPEQTTMTLSISCFSKVKNKEEELKNLIENDN